MDETEQATTITDFDDLQELLEAPAPLKLGPGDRIPPTCTLGRYILEAALTPAIRRRLRAPGSLAVIIQAPTPAWVGPLREAAADLTRWTQVVARDGSDRTSHRPDKRNSWIVDALTVGGRALGIAAAPDRLLPSTLTATADIWITVRPPSPAVLRQAIKAATGTLPRQLPDGLGVGLDFPELCVAIRSSTSARSCIRRLQDAAVARNLADKSVATAAPISELHGYDAVMPWATGVIRDLQAWRRGEIPFDSIDSRVVLASEPGLGKTSFVRSLARSAQLPLVATSMSAWFTGGPGYLDSVLRQAEIAFAEAAALASTGLGGSLLLLDEVDAVPDRRGLEDRNRAFWTTVIQHLLTILDGSQRSTLDGVVIVGATNHGNRLDPALIRPGRLGRIIEIGRPDVATLARILRFHLGDDLKGEDLFPLAELGVGASGADAMAWVKRARHKARAEERDLVLADLLEEIAPRDARATEDLWRAAVHEACHAVVSHVTNDGVVRSISIVGQGRSGGQTVTMSRDVALSRAAAERRVMTALAGHVGETVICGQPTSGSSSDLAMATKILVDVHAAYGLGDTLLHRPTDNATSLLLMDPLLRQAVEDDLARLRATTTDLLTEHRPLIEELARLLVSERQIGARAFIRFVEEHLQGRRVRTDRDHPEATHG
ncbi:AAA family ATPase [Microvirga sp. 3-52]|uniref:AAA family ATPase n=1 Tax=Microvirga sp. 3-52 TaxID=2792425 RepID=UPI001AD38A89|nr:AAA family ATPase [Microvirga sp. 3-52]MBO1905304.1 AAA family ATPase [Microvirga sp. 3-52]MBS7452607.1 AAA family ATPase [Microvirga sp. 3-52]